MRDQINSLRGSETKTNFEKCVPVLGMVPRNGMQRQLNQNQPARMLGLDKELGALSRERSSMNGG